MSSTRQIERIEDALDAICIIIIISMWVSRYLKITIYNQSSNYINKS